MSLGAGDYMEFLEKQPTG